MSDRLTVIPYDLSSEQRDLEYRDIGLLSAADGVSVIVIRH